jgi:hypothetical protein
MNHSTISAGNIPTNAMSANVDMQGRNVTRKCHFVSGGDTMVELAGKSAERGQWAANLTFSVEPLVFERGSR